jgi:hypothetical protein
VTLKTELTPTGGCLAIERFGEPLTDDEKAHVHACARCEAELALWRQFTESNPTADEGAAVSWIVAELHRRRAAPRAAEESAAAVRRRVRVGWRSLMGVAAALAVIVIGYFAWDPEPRIGAPTPGEQVYRTTTVDVIGPTGDVPQPPTELAWTAVDGAVAYDVRVLEIDSTVLWRSSSASPRIALPEFVITQMVPGKTLLWQVSALDRAGATIAESGTQRFRIPITTSSGRQ